MPELPFKAVGLVVLVSIIVLLERKVKGGLPERLGRTIGKLRE